MAKNYEYMKGETKDLTGATSEERKKFFNEDKARLENTDEYTRFRLKNASHYSFHADGEMSDGNHCEMDIDCKDCDKRIESIRFGESYGCTKCGDCKDMFKNPDKYEDPLEGKIEDFAKKYNKTEDEVRILIKHRDSHKYGEYESKCGHKPCKDCDNLINAKNRIGWNGCRLCDECKRYFIYTKWLF